MTIPWGALRPSLVSGLHRDLTRGLPSPPRLVQDVPSPTHLAQVPQPSPLSLWVSAEM